jgi:hypothetical protein
MDVRRVRRRWLAFVVVVAVAIPAAGAAQTAAAPQAQEAPKVRIAPYGLLFFNAFWNDGGTNNADVPLWATGGPGNASASGRQSRLGLRVTGATFRSAKVAAVVEADFYGGFPAIGIGDNMGVLRLRLANARLDWTRGSLVVGQDWMVFAPANPISNAAAGIPLLAAAGNPWSRLPQVRGEWRVDHFVVQGALLAPSTGDFSSQFLYQPASGALSQWPFLQGRAAYIPASFAGVERPATLGFSGHYGRSRVVSPTERTVDSRGMAADWSLPLPAGLTISGEAFAGRNLAAFQAGIFQGLNLDGATDAGSGLVADGPRSIRTAGGWIQIAAAVTGTVTATAVFGIDDPNNEDLLSVAGREARLRNVAAGAGFQHKASAQFTWGVEYRHLTTTLLVGGRQNDDHVNVAVTFSF